MTRLTFSMAKCVSLLPAILVALAFTGCATPVARTDVPAKDTAPANTDVSQAKADVAKPETPPAVALPTIRIKAGADATLTDSKGIVWAADTDFDGGESGDRPDLQITGTDRPELYRAEHYSMNSYTIKVPNGDYTVTLHFSEDYDGITDASGRIFTYTVKDGDPATGKTLKEVKDFSPWKAAGAQFKAYVDTIPVTVTSGQISIKFTPQVENPQINAIEITPR